MWPVPPTSTPHPATSPGPGKVVVVSTTHDPATPYQAGVDLARQMGASGELVVNGGHVLVDDLARARRTTFAAGTHLDFAAGPGGRIATSGETVVLDLALGPLSAARASDLDQGLAKLEIRLRHRGKYDAGTHRLALETLAIDLGRAELALSGVVDSVGSRPLCDLRAQGAHIDLEQVLGWLSVADAARSCATASSYSFAAPSGSPFSRM